MPKRVANILLTGGGAAVALCLSATAVSAATWSISPKGNFTGTLNSGTLVRFTDTTTGIPWLTCTVAAARGNVPESGSGLSGTGIAKLTSVTFGSSSKKCTGPMGSTFTATGISTLWNLNAVSYNSKVDGGQTTGMITASGTGVGVKITGQVLGVHCSATIGGTTSKPASASVLYDNGSHLLAITGTKNLKVLESNWPRRHRGRRVDLCHQPNEHGRKGRVSRLRRQPLHQDHQPVTACTHAPQAASDRPRP